MNTVMAQFIGAAKSSNAPGDQIDGKKYSIQSHGSEQDCPGKGIRWSTWSSQEYHRHHRQELLILSDQCANPSLY
jgi:hypothetical protein